CPRWSRSPLLRRTVRAWHLEACRADRLAPRFRRWKACGGCRAGGVPRRPLKPPALDRPAACENLFPALPPAGTLLPHAPLPTPRRPFVVRRCERPGSLPPRIRATASAYAARADAAGSDAACTRATAPWRRTSAAAARLRHGRADGWPGADVRRGGR